MDIKPHISLARFARKDDGAVAVIVALLLTVLMGFVALGVDVASLYRERAQLQAVSDLTAVSAVSNTKDANRRALNAISRNTPATAGLKTLEKGRYLRNPAIPINERFTPLDNDNIGINAVRVVLENDAPLYFGRIFTDDTHVGLTSPALASRTGAASFELSSNLARLDGTAINDALIQRFGSDAALALNDIQSLAGTDVNLGEVLEALRSRTGDTNLNPAEILNATTTVSDLVAALQDVLPNAMAGSLSALENAAGTTAIDVSALVGGIDADLGLTATEFLAEIDVSALDVINSAIAAEGSSESITIDTAVSVPGVASVTTGLVLGEPPSGSGSIALGEAGVQMHRAVARLQTEVSIEPSLLDGLLGGVEVASVNLPLYTEVAGSTATLEEISCSITSPDDVAARFTTSVTPLRPASGTSVAALYLGNLPNAGTGPIDPADLEYADLLDINIVIPGALFLPDITIAGLTIQARSHVAIGASQEETVTFTQSEIADGRTTKYFGSGEVLSTAISGLLSSENTELRVKPGQEGLVSVLAAPVLATLFDILPGALLGALASPIDSVLDGTLGALGLSLGEGQLTATGHHCEPIRLVR